MASEKTRSILYEPVNAVWDRVAAATGLEERIPEVPEHVVMAFFVVFLVALITIPLRARLKKRDPGWFQQVLELVKEVPQP